MEDQPDTKASAPPPQPPPQQQESEPKKLKMSSPSDPDEDAAAAKPRYKRRKVAIFFAYCGVGYQGMQKNPGAKTIEADLEEALFHAGAVAEQDRGNSKRYDFARSARTDKGVSAVGQVVSGKFYVDPPGFADRLNAALPDQIRIFGYKRVTASFSSKKFCDRRRYVYLIPVFALDPTCHREAKCLECSEKGHKVVGLTSKLSSEPNVNVDSKDCPEDDSVSNSENNVNGDAIVETEVKEVVVSSSESVKEPEIAQTRNSNSNGELNSESFDSSMAEIEEGIDGEEKGAKQRRFYYGEEERGRFNRILNKYVGTHNFHNFTTRMKADDPAAKRYIISFDASTTVTVGGIEFVKCEVVGQSFMLHQIRKMMGLAVAIMRNYAPESLIETALQKDVYMSVPTAPEVGLYLDECLFSSYNDKWKNTHEEISMKDYAEEAEDFKMKHIYTHIAAAEHKEGAVALWLHSLDLRNYTDSGSRNGTISNAKNDENGKSSEVEENPE